MAGHRTLDDLDEIGAHDRTLHDAKREIFEQLLREESAGESFELIPQAAKSKDRPAAIYWLAGYLHEYGIAGAAQDDAEAKSLYDRAVDDPRAARGMADLYQFGRGVEQSDDAAARWRSLANTLEKLWQDRAGVAAIGKPPSHENLPSSEYFRYGIYVPVDSDLKDRIKRLVQSTNKSHGLHLSIEQQEAVANEIEEVFATAMAVSPPRLPDAAPEKYSARSDKRENIVDFLKRIYPRELEAGSLSRPALLNLDGSAYKALENWNGNPHRDASEKLYLPTKKDLVDRQLSHVDKEQLREARRLTSALVRRGS